MRLLNDVRAWHMGPCAVALGLFDGVHKGHAALVAETVRLARAEGLAAAVFTFGAHPLAALHPQEAPPMLTTPPEKAARLAALGLDALLMTAFDEAFAAMTPQAFPAYLADALTPRHVVVGFNYTFGARGAGDAALLTALGKRHAFTTHVLAPVCCGGLPISSTRVRQAVLAGDMAQARAMLGEAYGISGTVIHGKGLGRKLGFPTANLALPADKALPPFGVYAAWVAVAQGRYPAVVNIGAHPTAPGGPPALETHLLAPAPALYDQPLTVLCEARLRPERTFENLDALAAQVAMDVAQARVALGLAQADGRAQFS
ncbi:MAG: riboflavin biosynthesis protein RibF [Oscillospiraceae bacterium]|jgi:riboflavin kinase/FMN adenylyltransferase|nr:riboflavin biosynthesis protein RibF [Oscillospiraceae bacterium]